MVRGWFAVFGLGILIGLLPLGEAEARVLRWARSIDASTLDPHAANTGPNILLAHQIYEPLILRQLDGRMVPALASSWSLVDPTTWEFRLRPGVTFHDGSPLTAEDVAFSLERAHAPTSDMKSLLSSIESVAVAGELSVRIRTKGPDPLLPNNLTDIFVMSRAWSLAHGAAEPGSAPGYAATNANGTGPFRLESREPGKRTVLVRNEAYWGRGEVPLALERIVYTPIPGDGERAAALIGGQVDFVQDVSVASLQRLEGERGIRVASGPENRSIFLGLDLGSKALRRSDIKDRNPFADRRVREAMNMAIDRRALQRDVMAGYSAPAGAIVPPSSNGYSSEIDRPPPFDLVRARALMQAAGYEGGFSVTLHCTNDRYVNDTAICRTVASQLGRIGIRVEVAEQPAAVHFGQVRRSELDFYLLGWGVTTFDSEYIFSLLYHTNAGDLGGWNGTRFSDPAVDAQIKALRNEIDQTRRDAAIARLWRRLKDEVVYLPLHNQMVTQAMREEFEIPIDVSNQPKMKFVGARP